MPKNNTRKNNNKSRKNNNSNNANSNNNRDGLTVGKLREALKGVADKAPVYHVEFGGLTRSHSAKKDGRKLIVSDSLPNNNNNTRKNNNNKNNTRKNNNNSGYNSNNLKEGLTAGKLRRAIAGLPDSTPVYHVEFGGLTRSESAYLDDSKRFTIDSD